MKVSSSPIYQNKKFGSQEDNFMNYIMNEQKQRRLLLSPVHHDNSSDSITDEEIQPQKRKVHKKSNSIDEIRDNCGISSIEDLHLILISLRYEVSVNEKQITGMRNTISSITKEKAELSESYPKEKEISSELQEQLNNMAKQFEVEKEQKKQIKNDNEDIENEINELKALFDLVNVQKAKQSIQKLQNQFYTSNDSEYENKTQN